METNLILGGINLCSNVADEVLIPYIGNCTKYYSCLKGEAYSLTCPDGFQFDAYEQACVKSGATCLPDCSTKQLDSFCYDRTCSKYVLCFNEQAVLRECTDGLQYNEETDRCDFPQYVDCVNNMCRERSDPRDIVYIGSHATCEKYYICRNGYTEAQNCSAGLQFNKGCDCCDYPSNVNCTITTLKRNIQSYSRKPPARADITCPDFGTYFYPHKARAEAYYFCLDGDGVILDCTPGLFFDVNTEECREPKYITG